MSVTLPASFLEKMKFLLDDEYDNFMSSYDEQRYYGLRVNELKVSHEQWLGLTPFQEHLEPILWTDNAFYYEEQDRPGKHPHYHAGMYYIQEPSAMVPVELLDVQPGQRVLDLCAAPGGKSTQIASKLQGQGIIVSNDIATERTKVLAKNIELAGVRNAVVMNEHPSQIATKFPQWFDRVLIDAPCSGEGMFRKNESMIEEWGNFSVDRCSSMQREILDDVAKMVAPGGQIVYSTCTFSPEENEEQIARFLTRQPDFTVVQVEDNWGWAHGKHQWVSSEVSEQLSQEQLHSIDGTIRLWPHRMKGEGHYVAVLKRDGIARDITETSLNSEINRHIMWRDIDNTVTKRDKHESKSIKNGYRDRPSNKEKDKKKQNLNYGKSLKAEATPDEIWNIFAQEQVAIVPELNYEAVCYGNRVYLQPEGMPSLAGLKVVRAGWYIGELKNGKFIPSHPLAMGIRQDEAIRSINFTSTDDLLQRYLKGETIFIQSDQLIIKDGAKQNGYVLICVDHCPVGFGKNVDGMIKNELPAGWRLI
ncbi:RsmB/NOP family class I SAM-dependent RNA methyltransferase [Paenibacillus endoradicis]|uniref:RsmB/NOP family class I SAM-dependent RNA methyltransferase n=1 Tax=Paenibacillus endoradicis TaxID=2972487 RepID=UPI00215926E2|nr:RsmB/NOP family class I SAM-dependent RNA methyltransferase [Paenibacillus endoradicis]MCR8659148.1 RsmB/NOP family class I SAM-dependent RNA methyltransferase [Paenibacillus endoradicis]